MPTYDYFCDECKEDVERFLPMAHPPQLCERCHNTMRKLPTYAVFHMAFEGPQMRSNGRITDRKGNPA